MPDEVKRMNYYNGLFLKQEDFTTEQDYHINMRRLLNWHLNKVHGVMDGLKIEPVTGSRKFKVTEGIALSYDGDKGHGVEIVLAKDENIDLSGASSGDIYFTIKYAEIKVDLNKDKGDFEIHTQEKPVIETESSKPADPGKVLILGKITVPAGDWKSENLKVDTTERKEIGPALRSIDGNVGIGTTPRNKLDVEGNAAIGAGFSGQVAAPAQGLLVQGNVGIGTPTTRNKLDVEGGAAIGAGYSGQVAAPAQGLLVQGNVGIGTPTTRNKLDVEGGAAIGAGYSGQVAAPVQGLLVQGNVGIGVQKPIQKLEVAGTVKATSFVGDGSKLTGISTGVSSQWSDGAGGAIYYTKGNVGIGTATPVANQKLDVNGDIAISGKHAFRGADAWLRLNQDRKFTSGVHTPGNFAPMSLNVGGIGGWGNPGNGNAWITGNTGFGTTVTTNRLQINGDIAIADNRHRSGKIRMWQVGDNSDAATAHTIGTESFHNVYGAGSAYPSSIGHKFYRGGGELIAQIGFGGSGKPANRLDSHFKGNMQVSTHLTVGAFSMGNAVGRMNVSGPSAEFSFVKRQLNSWPATPAAGDRYVWYNSNGIARLWTHAKGDLLTVDSNGDIGYKGQLKKLDVENNFTATIRAADLWLGHSTRRGSPGRALVDWKESDGRKILILNYAGDWPQGVQYYNSLTKRSSRELKENITELSGKEALKALNGLNPTKFNLKADDKKLVHLGFIAEDTHDMIATSDKKAINNDHIVTVLTRVMKEQQKTITDLGNKIKTLEEMHCNENTT